jgi:hypothetical protein
MTRDSNRVNAKKCGCHCPLIHPTFTPQQYIEDIEDIEEGVIEKIKNIETKKPISNPLEFDGIKIHCLGQP